MNLATIASRAGGLAPALLLAFTAFACVHTKHPQSEILQSVASENGALVPVAARYRETRRDPDHPASSSDWYFIRSDTRIETARPGYAEMWEQDDRQDITWKRVFHGDRKVIDYTTGQLRAERRLRDWSVLATIFDQRTLVGLKQRGETTVFKQPAVRYQGRSGDEQIEVVWLTRQSIPAKIVRSNRDATYTLELKDLRAVPDASWPSVSEAQIQDYEGIDGSDLGDREYDPFVRKVLAMDGGGHGGHAH